MQGAHVSDHPGLNHLNRNNRYDLFANSFTTIPGRFYHSQARLKSLVERTFSCRIIGISVDDEHMVAAGLPKKHKYSYGIVIIRIKGLNKEWFEYIVIHMSVKQ